LNFYITERYQFLIIVGCKGAHSAAKTNYAIVMAMEQNEGEEGLTKFNSLYAKHEKTFLHLIRTCHPANIPNELPGKGSNEAYATQEAKNTLIALGLDINYLVFTVSGKGSSIFGSPKKKHSKKIHSAIFVEAEQRDTLSVCHFPQL
jgi:hypothetical protein